MPRGKHISLRAQSRALGRLSAEASGDHHGCLAAGSCTCTRCQLTAVPRGQGLCSGMGRSELRVPEDNGEARISVCIQEGHS